jgi:microcompartment protein CcmK/EutM
MQIGRVCGTVVATIDHPALADRRLLVVQPYDPRGQAAGAMTMAVDVVDAGIGDWVLVLDEGTSAAQVLGVPRGPIRTVVIGVVDLVGFEDGAAGARQSKTGQGVDSPGPV